MRGCTEPEVMEREPVECRCGGKTHNVSDSSFPKEKWGSKRAMSKQSRLCIPAEAWCFLY